MENVTEGNYWKKEGPSCCGGVRLRILSSVAATDFQLGEAEAKEKL